MQELHRYVCLCKIIRVNVKFGLLLESDWKGVQMFVAETSYLDLKWNYMYLLCLLLHQLYVLMATMKEYGFIKLGHHESL